MNSSVAQTFNVLGYGLGLLSLFAASVVFWLQLRTYRRTRHPSLEPLLFASAAAFAYSSLALLARLLWVGSAPGALALYYIAVGLAVVHVGLVVVGTARLLAAFERHVTEFHGAGPNNSSKPTPLRGAA